MLRICGVTFDHTTNYGSCLQAYALKTAIEKISIEGESYVYDLLPATILASQRKASSRSVTAVAKRIIKSIAKKYRRAQFKSFEDKYIRYADCHNREELPRLNGIYDAFVCGSDVIWNFGYTRGDTLYFLDFATKYKFSYAASFGKGKLDFHEEGLELDEDPKKIYERYISQLDRVSVREKEAAEMLKEFVSKPVECACDPVLLLTQDEWTKVIPENIKRGKYIFAYSTSTRPNYISFLKMIQKSTGLPVVNITWLPNDMVRQRAFTSVDPAKWLGLLKNAEYVVTNSFHGTAFSVLFEKKFFTVIQGDRQTRSNIRLYDFLENLELDSRLINEMPSSLDFEAPDFTAAKDKLEKIRESSLKYLEENLIEASHRKKGM